MKLSILKLRGAPQPIAKSTPEFLKELRIGVTVRLVEEISVNEEELGSL